MPPKRATEEEKQGQSRNLAMDRGFDKSWRKGLCLWRSHRETGRSPGEGVTDRGRRSARAGDDERQIVGLSTAAELLHGGINAGDQLGRTLAPM
jgi:hypothetical protein